MNPTYKSCVVNVDVGMTIVSYHGNSDYRVHVDVYVDVYVDASQAMYL